jgi:anti-sigma regulatory factor (Ser/Thr protein kinase)
VHDPALPDKSLALLDRMVAEGYRLDGDDCTAISIHMLDPLKIVIEQPVQRNIYLVSEIAKQCEMAVMVQGISRDTAGMLRLLVMELGANLVEHGGLREEDSFWLQVRVDGQVCQLVLMDEGTEWDLEEALNNQLDEAYMGDRGRGLAITHAVSDRIEHYRVDEKNLTYCTIIDQEYT